MRVGRLRKIFTKGSDLTLAYRATFETPVGDQVLKHLMKTGFVTESTYVQGDPVEGAHREGMRRLVLSILHQLNITDDDLKLMIDREVEHEPEE